MGYLLLIVAGLTYTIHAFWGWDAVAVLTIIYGATGACTLVARLLDQPLPLRRQKRPPPKNGDGRGATTN